MVFVLDYLEAGCLAEDFFHFFECEVVSTRLVTSHIKVVLQFLVPALCKAELGHVVPAIVPEKEYSSWG